MACSRRAMTLAGRSSNRSLRRAGTRKLQRRLLSLLHSHSDRAIKLNWIDSEGYKIICHKPIGSATVAYRGVSVLGRKSKLLTLIRKHGGTQNITNTPNCFWTS